MLLIFGSLVLFLTFDLLVVTSSDVEFFVTIYYMTASKNITIENETGTYTFIYLVYIFDGNIHYAVHLLSYQMTFIFLPQWAIFYQIDLSLWLLGAVISNRMMGAFLISKWFFSLILSLTMVCVWILFFHVFELSAIAAFLCRTIGSIIFLVTFYCYQIMPFGGAITHLQPFWFEKSKRFYS